MNVVSERHFSSQIGQTVVRFVVKFDEKFDPVVKINIWARTRKIAENGQKTIKESPHLNSDHPTRFGVQKYE